jgi:hypothetical protein
MGAVKIRENFFFISIYWHWFFMLGLPSRPSNCCSNVFFFHRHFLEW